MKINVAFPSRGTQKLFDIEDERKLSPLYDMKMSQEIKGELLGDQFAGYKFKIMGGHDKQGFPMKQGVMVNSRVRLLLKRGDIGHQAWRSRTGERRKKSIRGCIVGPDISVLNVIVVQQGPNDIEGLTDNMNPRRLGPKRASKIRKLFGLTKEDDVRKYVIKRKLEAKEGKKSKDQKTKDTAFGYTYHPSTPPKEELPDQATAFQVQGRT
eukprot:NODE_353_length_964_cov_662.511475_g307_i0.p1 GENE.NODE_353_length_964_cov_662.511475_g307_i0~~NODE_353_length_964_cov_662.511475_g307_i0.p1  ORF type:complete len:210 (-),score=54.16 NODE_353_length_964_cov_662.511475_g307_i0:222-851(-)